MSSFGRRLPGGKFFNDGDEIDNFCVGSNLLAVPLPEMTEAQNGDFDLTQLNLP
jgi:hypothetical protein